MRILFLLIFFIPFKNKTIAQDTSLNDGHDTIIIKSDTSLNLSTHDNLSKRIDSLLIQITELKKMDIVNSIIAPLLVAVIIGIAGWLYANLKWRKKIRNAPQKYVEELDKLIQDGVYEGPEKALINARAIVSSRDAMRKSLISISNQLNSEIDRLASEIGKKVELPTGPSIEGELPATIESKRAYETIQVLQKIWPAKKTQIKVEVQKLLTEMGLNPSKHI
ncbi:MAG: hypothetical protein NTW29_14495 [Bacteroidetes bacterium]|nr:hypothetical protein [Bacteroidota bacterium]